MATIRDMMGGGLSGGAALGIAGSIATGLTATGSTSQANSFPVTAGANFFSTVSANTGALLPSSVEVGSDIEIYNGGASAALLVYPHSGGNINGNATDASISVTTKKGVRVRRLSATTWGAIVE